MHLIKVRNGRVPSREDRTILKRVLRAMRDPHNFDASDCMEKLAGRHIKAMRTGAIKIDGWTVTLPPVFLRPGEERRARRILRALKTVSPLITEKTVEHLMQILRSDPFGHERYLGNSIGDG